jgi:hypothetical protein
MTNIDQTLKPTAKESADKRACLLNTHMLHDMIARKLICGHDTKFTDFAAIFIRENICVYGSQFLIFGIETGQ